ncbi:MAG: alpha/beta hydrolase, partial [Thiomicrorhabdus sp.]|nr:alpha/beta hydrolase [Thiomicrorhabdus sp.]
MKKIKVLIGLILFFSIQTFSQNDTSEKIVFTYKIVQGHEIKANIYLPESNGLHPVLIYFHGGGFIFGNRDLGLDNVLKEKLLSNNYAVVSADYRLAPETKLNEILKDVNDIVKWIKQNGELEYSIDTSKIVAVGGSAGGYLALSTGFNQISSPNAII